MEYETYTDVDLPYCSLSIVGVEAVASECFCSSLAISPDRTSMRLYFNDESNLREFHFIISLHACKKRKAKK